MIFNCCGCGTDFAAPTPRAKFCSPKCYKTTWRGGPYRAMKKCIVCGKPFEAKGTAGASRKTCSPECSALRRGKHNPALSRARERRHSGKTCAVCSAPWRADQPWPHASTVCSISCREKLRARTQAYHRKLEQLAFEALAENFPGLSVMEMFKALHKREPTWHHDGRALGSLALKTVEQLGERPKLEAYLKANPDWGRSGLSRNCIVCGDQFEHPNGNARICSQECQEQRLAVYRRRGTDKLTARLTTDPAFKERHLSMHRAAYRRRHPLKTRECIICGTEFTSEKHRNKCSQECVREYNRWRCEVAKGGPYREVKVCVICKRKFTAAGIGGAIKKSCSPDCAATLYRRTEQERYRKIAATQPTHRDCVECGTPFKRNGRRKNRQRYCSATCRLEVERRRANQRYHAKTRTLRARPSVQQSAAGMERCYA